MESRRIVQRRFVFNLRNRFLCICCHARDVGESWACNCSFQCGIVFFSLIILSGSFWDIVELAKYKIFQGEKSSLYVFIFCLKILSDIINLVVTFMACYAIYLANLRYSIICYWASFASIILNTIFLIYSLFGIFFYYEKIWHAIPAALLLEFGLLLFTWILFCNEIDLTRKISNTDYSFQH